MDPWTSPVATISRLHQALHGYASGHRLLESSIELPDEDARLMLRMSDLSASRLVPGFDEYVTGYPLESAGLYALAKTWYAREMSRPGCAWTHTLLLTKENLTVASLSPLTRLFKRPEKRPSLEAYSEPIEVIPTDPESPIEQDSNLARFIEGFYTVKPSPMVIPARSADEFEPMLMAIWSQQWPSLRRSFSFCTGSLASRRIGNKPLEVQCVPFHLVRDVQLEIDSVRASEESTLFDASFEVSPWTLVPAQDCLSPTGGEFRKFLWRVAGEEGKRKDYFAFTCIYQALSISPEPVEVLSLVADHFPSPQDSAHLKGVLFEEGSTYFSHLSDASLLAAIGSSSRSNSLDALALNVLARSAAVARDYDSSRVLIGGLFQAPLNDFGLEILAGLLVQLDSPGAREITREHPQFLTILINTKPSVATSPAIWSSAKDRRWALMESVVENKALEVETIKGIVTALLDSETDDLLKWAFEAWGTPAIFAALDWMTRHQGQLPELCRRALTFHVPQIIDWVEQPVEKPLRALFATADIIGPYPYQAHSRDTTVWEPALQDALGRRKEPDALRFLSFILALALGNAPPDPLRLVGETFEIIHQAEFDHDLPWEAWRILDPITPTVLPHYWDKCERMRRALIQSFVNHSWPPAELRRRISDPELVRDLVRSAKSVDGGKNYLKGTYR